MSTSVNHLDERTRDSADLLEEIMPSAITLAMMLRHRKMAAWLRTEFDGYQILLPHPLTADSYTGTSLPSLPSMAGFRRR